MNILIASDSFKDALDAHSVCQAIERGLKLADPSVHTRIFPLADGGEGVSDILNHHLGLNMVEIEVNDPLFRKIKTNYNLSKSGNTAFIEMAKAAGLQLLTEQERNPLKTTTFGVGEMIHDAIQKGAKRIILGIGGSATNDAGIGMANALGWTFLDKNDKKLLPIGENLKEIKTIIPPQYSMPSDINFEVMCDVKNPLLGNGGAAHIYARQKGANDADIELLEKGAKNLVEVANNAHDFANRQGAGAAGGLGWGALYFLNATIKSGIDAIMDLTDFDKHVTWADVIFTGEGRLDSQTANGKLIGGIITRAAPKPVIALCGALEVTPQYVSDLGLKAAFSITQKPCDLQNALILTAENLEKTAFNVGKILGLKI